MRKLGILLKYNSGIFNSKNEQVLAKSVNILAEKIDELIEKIEILEQQIKK